MNNLVSDLIIDFIIVIAFILGAAISLSPAPKVSKSLVAFTFGLIGQKRHETNPPSDENDAKKEVVKDRNSYFRYY